MDKKHQPQIYCENQSRTLKILLFKYKIFNFTQLIKIYPRKNIGYIHVSAGLELAKLSIDLLLIWK